MNALGKFNNLLNKLVMEITALMFVAMSVTVVFQVASRYLSNVSAPWTEEYARYLFIYVALFGSSAVVKTNGHVAVTLLVERLKGKVKYAVSIFATVVSCGFFSVMIYSGYFSMLRAARQLSPATDTNMGVIYAAVPISGAIMLLYSIEHLLKFLKQGPPPAEKE